MGRKLIEMLVFLCFLLPTVVRGAPLVVSVQPEATVRGKRITLGDVAEIRGDDTQAIAQIQAIVIGEAPAAGETRLLYGRYVTTRLKQHGFQPHYLRLTVPKRIRITRAARTLQAPEIEDAVRRAITEKAPWRPQHTTIRDIRGVGPLIVPLGHVRYVVTFPGQPDFLGPTSFTLQIHVEGTLTERVHGTAYIDAAQQVVTLVRPLAKYQLITAADVRVQYLPFSRPPRQVVTRLADAIGKRTRRSLRTNAMLRTYELEAQPLVQKGAVVTILVEAAFIKVTTVGEALENGVEGETIRVRNTASRREVRAVVLTKNTVRIPF